MVTRFNAMLALSAVFYVPLVLAATFPVAAFARQSGNPSVAPGSSLTLNLTQESQ